MVNEAQEVKFGTIPQWIRSRELSLTQFVLALENVLNICSVIMLVLGS